MKIKCCSVCVVQPMCNQGCEDLWVTYLKAKADHKRFKKYEGLINKLLLVFLVTWIAMMLFGVTVFDRGERTYTFKPLDFTFWHWWYTISYAIPAGSFLYLTLMCKRCKKIVKTIEDCGPRASYVFTQLMEDVAENIEKHKKGQQSKKLFRLM